jgi:glycosyltransferase involved in cell wall biosynthesis
MKTSHPTVSLIIPALNEAAGIGATIARAPKDLFEIIVVDGGSSDETVTIAQAAGAQVIVEPRRGYGLAYKRAFEIAKGDVIATLDADGTYPVELILEVADFVTRNQLSFVNCSRFPLANPKALARLNIFGNVCLSLVASLLYRHPFRDIASGMWVFRRSLLERMVLRSEGWTFSNEIKLEAYFAAPQSFSEIVIPFEPRVGQTHNISVWRTGFGVLFFMIGERFRHFYRSRVADPRIVRLPASAEDMIRGTSGHDNEPTHREQA